MEKELLIATAFIKNRLNDLRLSQLKPNSVKAEIGKIAQYSEFSNFSKQELLDFFKNLVIEILKEKIIEITNIEFK